MAQNNEAIPISLHNVAFRSTSCYMSQISMLIQLILKKKLQNIYKCPIKN